MNTFIIFRTAAEMFSIIVACGVFMMAWNVRRLISHSFFMFLGTAYAAVAVIDLVHTLTYPGMGFVPGDTGNLSTQAWIAARYLNAGALLVAPLLLRQRIPSKWILLPITAVGVGLLTVIFCGWFPTCYLPETGVTTFKIHSMRFGCAMIAAAMFLLWRRRDVLDAMVLKLLLISMALTIGMQLAFSLSTGLEGFFIVLGHLLKIAAFAFLYRAIVVSGLRRPYETLFHDLHQSEERYRQIAAELKATNNKLMESRRKALELLHQSVETRQQAEQIGISLQISEQRMQQALRVSRSFTFEWSIESDQVLRSDSCALILNLMGSEVRNTSGQRYFQSIHPDDREHFTGTLFNLTPTDDSYSLEYRCVRGDGGIVNLEEYGQGSFDSTDRLQRVIGVTTDITARKEAEAALRRTEEQLRISLAEKEVLLKEVHHRVKNNLQIISSLVDLQADSRDNPDLNLLLADTRDRVRTMALVHEKLYASTNLNDIEFGEYARSLLDYLMSAHGYLADGVHLALDLDKVSLPIEKSVSCGLILNELAGNALKHAFPEGHSGEIQVTLKHNPENGEISLRVRDNGVGLPADLDWRQTATLGLRLVNMLAGQLNGVIATTPGPGTEFIITFQYARQTP